MEQPNIDNQNQQSNGEIPLIEWGFAIVGFLLVTFSIGYLVIQGLRDDYQPPQINFTVVDVLPTADSQYLVQIEATNKGTQTAKSLLISGTLWDGDTSIETSEATFDYLPASSSRRGGLYFTQNPNDYRLELRALGYQNP